MLHPTTATLDYSEEIDVTSGLREYPCRPSIQLDSQFSELDLDFHTDTGVFWCRFRFSNRPSFTPEVLGELRRMRQLLVSRSDAAETADPQVKYMVLGSRMPGIFNLGDDLRLFAELIRRRDHAALMALCPRLRRRGPRQLGRARPARHHDIAGAG